MMPVSPWFFTNMPGFRKNWLWRGDDLWYDRWQQIVSMKRENQPEYLQIITWNDWGESHYVGPLRDKVHPTTYLLICHLASTNCPVRFSGI